MDSTPDISSPAADPAGPAASDDPALPLPEPRRERFALLLFQGSSKTAAYNEAGFSGKPGGNASRLSNSPDISARVRWLQAQATQKAGETMQAAVQQSAAVVHQAAMSRAEAIHVLIDIIRTPIGQIDEHHYLAQEVRDTTQGRVVKMPGKLEALRTLGDWLRWSSPASDTDPNHSVPLFVGAQVCALRNRRPLFS